MAFLSKHTTGEWVTGSEFYVEDEDGNNIEVQSITNEKGIEIALISYDQVALEEGDCNVKLLLAAPLLKQIAEMFYDHLGHEQGIVKNLIAKTLIDAGVEITPREKVCEHDPNKNDKHQIYCTKCNEILYK